MRRLVAAQFPQWAELPIAPVELGGWDNWTFRLGDGMSVRLPSAERYAAQVMKEQLWLPRLAPHLPLPIPTPLAMGVPGAGFLWSWSVYGWIEGEPANLGRIDDAVALARSLASFLTALQRIDASGAPEPGPHSFFRGGSLRVYDEQTRDAIAGLGGRIDGEACAAVWRAALKATRRDPPVWVHGDVAASNLLVRDGRLTAVIDFGCSSAGDPACDLAIGWTLFSGESRAAFRDGLALDDGAWARGRGWAIWKALITLAGPDVEASRGAEAERVIAAVLAEHAGA